MARVDNVTLGVLNKREEVLPIVGKGVHSNRTGKREEASGPQTPAAPRHCKNVNFQAVLSSGLPLIPHLCSMPGALLKVGSRAAPRITSPSGLLYFEESIPITTANYSSC